MVPLSLHAYYKTRDGTPLPATAYLGRGRTRNGSLPTNGMGCYPHTRSHLAGDDSEPRQRIGATLHLGDFSPQIPGECPPNGPRFPGNCPSLAFVASVHLCRR